MNRKKHKDRQVKWTGSADSVGLLERVGGAALNRYFVTQFLFPAEQARLARVSRRLHAFVLVNADWITPIERLATRLMDTPTCCGVSGAHDHKGLSQSLEKINSQGKQRRNRQAYRLTCAMLVDVPSTLRETQDEEDNVNACVVNESDRVTITPNIPLRCHKNAFDDCEVLWDEVQDIFYNRRFGQLTIF